MEWSVLHSRKKAAEAAPFYVDARGLGLGPDLNAVTAMAAQHCALEHVHLAITVRTS